MSKSPRALISIFLLKFALDFFSPFRELNFLILNLICAFYLIFLLLAGLRPSLKEVISTFIYLIFCCLWGYIGGELILFMKFASAPIIYFAVRLSVPEFTREQVKSMTLSLMRWFVVLLLLNIFASYVFANPREREFLNFEHANLLGSYILLSLAFVYVLRLYGEKWRLRGGFIALGAFLSSSTGAFLLSLPTFLTIRRLTLRGLVFALFSVIFGVFTLYYLLGSWAPELHAKIFSPVIFIMNGGLSELSALAAVRGSIQDLGDDFQSSLIWRFYAYQVFWDFITHQSYEGLLLGNGFLGFDSVWGGIAPHNDFLLVLIDFGLLAFIALMVIVVKALVICFKKEPMVLPLLLVAFLRFSFENNIYSYYIYSGLTMHAAYFLAARSLIRKTK